MSQNFKTQQEIWDYLAKGGKVKGINNGKILYFTKNGEMSENIFTFTYPEEWQKHVESEVVESVISVSSSGLWTWQDDIYEKLKGKRWKVVATEIVE